jgi:hypothetical protein
LTIVFVPFQVVLLRHELNPYSSYLLHSVLSVQLDPMTSEEEAALRKETPWLFDDGILSDPQNDDDREVVAAAQEG